MIGQPHPCLTTCQKFDEAVAFAPLAPSMLATAA
jgi:hypothetical protein